MTDVVCLFEESGLSADAWARAGFDVYCYDIVHKTRRVEHVGAGRKIFMPWDARDAFECKLVVNMHKGCAAITLCFPPCTDLAVSGAKHFARKLAANPEYRNEAMALVYTARDIAEAIGAPYAIENPRSVISTEWRKPDYGFEPWEYGGYLPENDAHPTWPDYIAPRDAYPKTTYYWVGGGFVMPPKRPVPVEPGYSKQFKKLGGKSAKTKSIRSASPRGVNIAIFAYNR